MKKIVTVIGARPQFIKAAVVSRAILKKGNIIEIIIHTGQHFDKNMSDIFFEEMDIPKPTYFLDINGLTHGAMTGQMLERIEQILISEKPDMMLVYGDTNSTLAGALAACKLNIPVAHVESGLRSYNLLMPEEYNRILTDRISKVLFVPSEAAAKNLADEGFSHFPSKIFNSGDVMYDAVLFYSKKTELVSQQIKDFISLHPKYVLATLHRQENTNDIQILSRLVQGLNEINKQYPVIVPLHPRTRKILESNQLEIQFTIIDPVGYIDMLHLTKNSGIVITDSGGLQKEAYFMKKYCVTIRTETEWIELVTNGYNFIVGSDIAKMKHYTLDYINKTIATDTYLYGNGNSGDSIANTLVDMIA